MSPVIAERRLKQFQQKFGEAMVEFATHAALPVVLNSELVHLLRLNFFYPYKSISYFTEAEFLLSSFCREIGEDLYEMIKLLSLDDNGNILAPSYLKTV